MIELKNLCAGYGGREILHGLDLTLRRGEITAIVGPNGCGKSTLLKTLIRAVDRSGGSILIDGREQSEFSPGELAREIAYLPQGKAVPEITAKRMVLHGRFPYLSYPRRYSREDRRIVEQAMSRMGILELEDRPLNQLSGGTRQKVYIAMVLAQDTPFVLMDEPTTGLDISRQLQLMDMSKTMAGDGKAVVMVLHDISMAMEHAGRLAVMDEGRILACGTPEEIFAQKLTDRVFGVRVDRFQTKSGWKYYCENCIEC